MSDTLELCISEIDGLSICFPIKDIKRFGDAAALHKKERTLNMADHLGLARGEQQHAAFIENPSGIFQILLGAHIAVCTLPLTHLHRLPCMVAEHGTQLGIIGTVHTETGLGYLFDVNTLGLAHQYNQ